jgi:hypothetical protein
MTQPSKSFEEEWNEFLNEVRVALPGVQLLFAFLFTAPFSERFGHIRELLRVMYFATFSLTAAACAFLMAPSVYHRLHWRRDVKDKEQMLQTCNRLAIYGITLLSLAMTSAVFVVSNFVFDVPIAGIITAGAAIMFGLLWFALPLSRRRRDRHPR